MSVLSEEVLKFLEVKLGGWYLDGTLGDGGHSLAILEQGGNILGIDQDPEALERTEKRFIENKVARERFKLIRGNFGNLLKLVGDQKFSGVLFDLGLSQWQLEKAERGFSFLKEAPLDMRMDPDLGVSALELVNVLNKGELEKLFWIFGEVRDRRIVEAIIRARGAGFIKTTTQLAGIVEKAVGRKGKIHPATQIFQALRIAVNDELNNLKVGLGQAGKVLSINGTICIISFHSLEDRIVKDIFKTWEKEGFGEIITKKPLIPTPEEIKANPRSRSAKLRVFRKGEYVTNY